MGIIKLAKCTHKKLTVESINYEQLSGSHAFAVALKSCHALKYFFYCGKNNYFWHKIEMHKNETGLCMKQ